MKTSHLIHSLIVVMTCTSMAGADDAKLCVGLKHLTEQAYANFVDMNEDKNGSGLRDLPLDPPKCQIIRSLGGANQFHCAWAFQFREIAAKNAYNLLNQHVAECFGNNKAGLLDKQVNHPDTYQQRQHEIGPVKLSISIKDKGALQETYVFMNVQGVPE